MFDGVRFVKESVWVEISWLGEGFSPVLLGFLERDCFKNELKTLLKSSPHDGPDVRTHSSGCLESTKTASLLPYFALFCPCSILP